MSTHNMPPLRNLETANDKKWYSYIKKIIEEASYGSIDISLTIKNGEVMTIKTHSSASYSIHNGK